MSRTYSLYCRDTNKILWIGQSSTSSPTGLRVYATPEAIEKLTAFLKEHEGKAIEFNEDNNLPDDAIDMFPDDAS
jgi:hypothetical protein